MEQPARVSVEPFAGRVTSLSLRRESATYLHSPLPHQDQTVVGAEVVDVKFLQPAIQMIEASVLALRQ